MNHVTHPFSSADLSIFFTKNQQILLYQEIHDNTDIDSI